ncbi:MAG: hypothetical protein PHW52_01145 [Candidatus Pacebacteria bacterium]|nr:hypothetical protein [Candidatus Paceibacterota bacterium]
MNNKKIKYDQGLATVEFFVVIIIIFFLIGCIMIFMAGAVKEANDAERKSCIAQLMRILLTLRIDSGEFPIQPMECAIGKDCANFDKILTDKLLYIPKDPRGEGYYYYYRSDGKSFSLKAIMANGSSYVYTENNN